MFIGGSRRITRLPIPVRRRLDRIVEQRLAVVIGDANGADKAVQRYLRDRHHADVVVFATGSAPRNNVGAWPLRTVHSANRTRDFDYHAAKDRVMAQEATIGLMLWDGESKGTLLNILRLLDLDKRVVVYVAPAKTFSDVRGDADFASLVRDLDRNARRRLGEQATSEGLGLHGSLQGQLRL